MNLVEVKPLKDNINIIKESLSRMGIANKLDKILYPTCHLYEVDGKFYVAHFKELFLELRENSYNNISTEDIQRRNAIIQLLVQWKLVDVVNDNEIEDRDIYVYIVKHCDKKDWEIKPKFKFFDDREED